MFVIIRMVFTRRGTAGRAEAGPGAARQAKARREQAIYACSVSCASHISVERGAGKCDVAYTVTVETDCFLNRRKDLY